MKVHRHKFKTEQEWQDFLAQCDGSLIITNHCLERIAKRFPELLEMTRDDFIRMIKEGKICFALLAKDKKFKGAIVRNEKFGFIISFNNSTILTIFKFRKQSAKRVTLNPKGDWNQKKTTYQRPKAKKITRQIIAEETSA